MKFRNRLRTPVMALCTHLCPPAAPPPRHLTPSDAFLTELSVLLRAH